MDISCSAIPTPAVGGAATTPERWTAANTPSGTVEYFCTHDSTAIARELNRLDGVIGTPSGRSCSGTDLFCLERQFELHALAAAGLDSDLGRSRWVFWGRPASLAAVRDVARGRIVVELASSDAAATCKITVRVETARTLRRGQLVPTETGGRQLVGGTGSRDVPFAVADKTAGLAVWFEVARGARSSGGGWRSGAGGGRGGGGRVLRNELDARVWTRGRGDRVHWHVVSVHHRAVQMVKVPDLVQGLVGIALEIDLSAELGLQRLGDGILCVCGGIGRHNARVLEPLVRRQVLKELHGFFVVVHDLLVRFEVLITGRLDSAETGAVFVELVHPEVIIVALVIFPIRFHGVEEIRFAERGEHVSST